MKQTKKSKKPTNQKKTKKTVKFAKIEKHFFKKNKRKEKEKKRKRKRGLQGVLQDGSQNDFFQRNVRRNRAAIEAKKHILSTRVKKKKKKKNKKTKP